MSINAHFIVIFRVHKKYGLSSILLYFLIYFMGYKKMCYFLCAHKFVHLTYSIILIFSICTKICAYYLPG